MKTGRTINVQTFFKQRFFLSEYGVISYKNSVLVDKHGPIVWDWYADKLNMVTVMTTASADKEGVTLPSIFQRFQISPDKTYLQLA